MEKSKKRGGACKKILFVIGILCLFGAVACGCAGKTTELWAQTGDSRFCISYAAQDVVYDGFAREFSVRDEAAFESYLVSDQDAQQVRLADSGEQAFAFERDGRGFLIYRLADRRYVLRPAHNVVGRDGNVVEYICLPMARYIVTDNGKTAIADAAALIEFYRNCPQAVVSDDGTTVRVTTSNGAVELTIDGNAFVAKIAE